MVEKLINKNFKGSTVKTEAKDENNNEVQGIKILKYFS